MKITPNDRQSIFDIAMIGNGSAESAYEIAYKNSVSVSSMVTGMEFTVDTISNKRVVDFFRTRKSMPATKPPFVLQIFDITFDLTFGS